MPTKSSPMTNTFSVADVNNEVVCPLKNHDGSSCRKRCIGEKRYRSMQEHIRRAHPEHYIPKLPATEESFLLMINSPPSERPPPAPASAAPAPPPTQLPLAQAIIDPYMYPATEYPQAAAYSRSSDEFRRGSIMPTANAAEALASLHTHRTEFGFEHEQDPFSSSSGNNVVARSINRGAHFAHGLDIDPQIYRGDELFHHAAGGSSNTNSLVSPRQPHQAAPQHQHHHLDTQRQDDASSPPSRLGARELQASPLARSPPHPLSSTTRTSTLPDWQTEPRSRTLPPGHLHRERSHTNKGASRLRKNSVTQNARLPKHERKKSREVRGGAAERDRDRDRDREREREREREKRESWRFSVDRKAMSAEPSSAAALLGKRWEDLIDAAASATEEDSRDLTPIPSSPQVRAAQNRSSLPPYLLNHTNHNASAYTNSPLNRVLTPPGPDPAALEPFPSVESSAESKASTNNSIISGQNFHISTAGLEDSSPIYAGIGAGVGRGGGYAPPGYGVAGVQGHGHATLGGSLFPSSLAAAASSSSSSMMSPYGTTGITAPPILSPPFLGATPALMGGRLIDPTAHNHQQPRSTSTSAPTQDIQIYCAGCHRLSLLSQSYACTECICGLCPVCVDALSLEQSRGRLATCPKCKGFGGRFKVFQLDVHFDGRSPSASVGEAKGAGAGGPGGAAAAAGGSVGGGPVGAGLGGGMGRFGGVRGVWD